MTNSGTPNTRLYSQEDIQQILHLAIARQANDNKEFSYQELLEIAAELEIPHDCLQLAERDWQAQQVEINSRLAFNKYRRSRLQKQFGNYTIVNSAFMLLDFLQGHNLNWSLYILLLWGLKLGLDTWNTFQIQGEDYERAFQKWYRQKQIKQSINTIWNKWLKVIST